MGPATQTAQKRLPTAVITVLPSKSVKTPLTSTPTVTSPEAAVTVVLQRQLIQFWYIRQAGKEDAVQKLVEEFNKTNRWGIRVEAVPQDSSGLMDEALNNALQEKKLPAVLSGYSHDLQYWNTTGILLVDLQDYVDDPTWGISSTDQQDFFPIIWEQDVLAPPGSDQKQTRFGLPWYRDGLVMLYNQSWAEELEFDTPPSTPSQFRLQACAAARANREDTDKENNGTGGWLIDREPSALLSWIFAFGGQIEQPAGYQFDSPSSNINTYIHEHTHKGVPGG
jgi:ABC-type glycerol-3-phosphate transport system substrate-binding protein